MKKLLLASLLYISTFAAATEVRSIRTSNDFVEIGNSQAQVQSKLGSPSSTNHYVLRDKQDRPRAATDLSYTVDNEKYIVTIVNGNVYKIEWVR